MALYFQELLFLLLRSLPSTYFVQETERDCCRQNSKSRFEYK